MDVRASVVKGLFACFLTVAAGSGLTAPALAQHVVTDYEAGKLTLDALTATPRPMVHRVMYRPSRTIWFDGRSRSTRAVHLATFHRSIRETSTTAHYGISHRRRRS